MQQNHQLFFTRSSCSRCSKSPAEQEATMTQQQQPQEAPTDNATTAEPPTDSQQNSNDAQPTIPPQAPPKAVDVREIQYAADSYYAIVRPVFLTMVLAAFSVVYIRTDESAAAGEAALTNSYTVLGGDDEDDGEEPATAREVGESFVNGLVIVSVICALTFFIVLLYKYRCMKLLIGYMILSSALLLGVLAAQMFEVALEVLQWPLDVISFWFIMWNFAITGCVCIFAPQGVAPAAATQGYLIATSVVVAWQLSHFSEILAWVLLVLLALYDLFAVLTPCGPLKALVKLMQRDDAPNMPGLLYEASLQNGQQQQRQQRNNASNTTTSASGNSRVQNQHHSINNSENERGEGDTASETEDEEQIVVVDRASNRRLSSTTLTEATTVTPSTCSDEDQEAALSSQSTFATTETTSNERASSTQSMADTDTTTIIASSSLLAASIHDHETTADSSNTNATEPVPVPPPTPEMELVTGRIPLALARLYKLRFAQDPQPYWITRTAEVVYTPSELSSQVDVLFAARGGRIVPTVTLDTAADVEFYRRHAGTEETRYTVVSSSGEHRRVLFVNDEGRIFEDLRVQNEEEERKERTSIKLGLGDFIFYSILVSKAALYSFTAFAVCSLAILAGLGLTLLLLAVYGKALPALPISIALGVVFYLTTRFMAEPWVHEIFLAQVYV